MKQAQKTIIWDWNGTLLDDVDICMDAINSMLEERGLNKLSRDAYRSVFTFPVINYYRESGFDFEKEEWEVVAMQFMDRYFEKLPHCTLFPDAVKILEFFKTNGYRQVILSAMEQNALTSSVTGMGIANYFQQVIGIDNHYAAGKSGNGRAMMIEHGLGKESTWFIGDTLHDAAIAKELGCQCILIANGHQDKQRLAGAGVTLLHSLSELIPLFTI
jgi:phosphoglycolate phosphatase